MSIADLTRTPKQDLQRPVAVRARISRPPASTTDSLTVVLINYASTFEYEIAANHWDKSGSLPQAGDICLVVFDDDGDTWLVARRSPGSNWQFGFSVNEYGSDAAAKAAALAPNVDVIYLPRADYHFLSEDRVRGNMYFGRNPSADLFPDAPDKWAAIDFVLVTDRGGGNRGHFRALNLVGIDPPELVFRGLGPNNTAPFGPNQDGTELERALRGRGLGRVAWQGFTGNTFSGWACHIGCEAAEDFRQDSLIVQLAVETEFGPSLPPQTVQIIGSLNATPSQQDAIPRAWQAGGRAVIGGTSIEYAARDDTHLYGVRGGGTKTAFVFLDPVGENNKLKFTAKATGAAGNSISIRYVDPGAPNAALSVSLAGTAITVNLATDATGAITTLAIDIQGALRAHAGIAALINIGNKFQDSNGSGIVTAMPVTNLAGGADTTTFPVGQNIQQTQVANAGILHIHSSMEDSNSRSERIRLHPNGSVLLGEKLITEGVDRPYFGIQGGQILHKKVPPAANPVATIVGTPGTTTIVYKIVGNTPGGGQTEPITLTVSNAPNTLSSTNYVLIEWQAGPGVETWDVIRESTTGTPSTTGPIAYRQRFDNESHFAAGPNTCDYGQAPVGLNEVQTVTVRNADEGTFQLSSGSSGPTAAINWDQDAATFETLLEALSTIGSGNVDVLKVALDPPTYQCTFVGALAATDVPLLSVVLPHSLVNNPDEGEDPSSLPPPDVNIRERTKGGPVAYTLPGRNSTADLISDGLLEPQMLRLPELAADPPAPDTTHGLVYMKDSGGHSKPFVRSSAGVKRVLDEDDVVSLGTGDASLVRKTSDQTLTQSSTAFQDITGLLLPLLASEVWFFQVFLDLSAASVNADFKFEWSVPAGTTYKLQRGADTAGVAAGSSPGVLATNFATLGALNGEFISKLEGYILVGGTAGNAQLRGAQNTAQAEDNKVLANSFILARKLA